MREQENRALTRRIEAVHRESHSVYGAPRITRELHKEGFQVSQRRVERLMKDAGIRSVTGRKFKKTTDSAHSYPVVGDLLKRDFTAEREAQVWVSDITYLWTQKGWVYLTVVIDLYDRKVVGWSLSRSLTAADTSIAAWRDALYERDLSGPLIFHSDRGVQYACDAFVRELEPHKGLQRSMSRKGDCWDNAVAESFFRSLKTEWTHRWKFKDLKNAELAVFEYIDSFYNTRRLHSSIGYMAPNQCRKMSNRERAA
jgi:transposase InsO family protein